MHLTYADELYLYHMYGTPQQISYMGFPYVWVSKQEKLKIIIYLSLINQYIESICFLKFWRLMTCLHIFIIDGDPINKREGWDTIKR